MSLIIIITIIVIVNTFVSSSNGNEQVLSGTGIYDCTGPIVDVVMMGMANPKQVSSGLHQRLRARSFVVLDQISANRFAFVSLDAGMGSDVLNNRVMEKLAERFGNLYTHGNVAISGTHTHSGPSGFLQNTIFQFAGSGWVPETLDSFTNCVVESISMAHHNLVPATASIHVGFLNNSNINRSPSAYTLNPIEERESYKLHGDTDKNMTLLKIMHQESYDPIGMFNWFAVHPTSLNNTNLLVSGDNKGYASYLFERDMNGPGKTGRGPFVAGFASSNLGDVSPNTNGAHCRDTGKPCDYMHSTCNGKSEQCSSSGPGKDMFDSCRIIGTKQYEKAKELFHAQGISIAHSADSVPMVDYRYNFVKMPGLEVTDAESGQVVGHLCKAAMGDSFAAGTTDGPGQFDFTQGANSSNPFWHFLVGFIHKPSPEEKACQYPKGILLPTGSVNVPYPWAPTVVQVQLLRWGKLIIVVVPSELSTMSGRRMRKHIRKVFEDAGMCDDCHVVVSGLANGYADYTTTFEEYQQQRYEAASTIFGPHQLNAYIQEVKKLAVSMVQGTKIQVGDAPEDFSHKCLNTGPRNSYDTLPRGADYFGSVVHDVEKQYPTKATVSVTFAGSNPIHDSRVQESFLEVQHCAQASCATFDVIAGDSDWETKLVIHKLKAHERLWEVTWTIPENTPGGYYRIQVFGSYKRGCLLCRERIVPFIGSSSIFIVGKVAFFSNFDDYEDYRGIESIFGF